MPIGKAKNQAMLLNKNVVLSDKRKKATFSSLKGVQLQKGGVPAAPSGTATLLRLSPNHEPHLRRLHPKRVRPPASGAAHFHDLTGGVYKARERIHRDVADSRLLATPPSRSRVADYDPN